ncbi:amidohydrolase family protein [Shinella sp.]|uniref:amidohydrolase family protein n=1 Tax=Shinella sp. TaxID=1870904 RepID=UPI00258DA319|nr:amidohydrolase family protein [Shinella sp.]MCW5706677.1 amidohydrolase family protein [Shinella sp.]
MRTIETTSPADAGAGGQRLAGVTLAGREGHWDIAVSGGRIAALAPSAGRGGGLVLPLMADIHTHLDKTFTAPRMPARATSLFHAIEMMQADAALWDHADLRQRASRALDRAYRHGTALMRSHVDWYGATPPPAWAVLRELAGEWQGRIHLELASLTPLDLFAEIGEAIAREVKAAGGVLGAFVYRNDDLDARLAQVFDLAEKHGLLLDFHVDEGLEVEARGIDAIVAETERRGLAGRVLCGHGCALSVRDPAEVADVLARAGAAGVGLTVLPGCNAYLQDAKAGRTPRLRGLAPVHEARAAGLKVMIGSDNVRDAFFPFGDYDLFDAFRGAALLGHLQPEDWLDTVSETPARWMGRSLALAEGGPADFIRLDAEDLIDALSRPRADRTVWRNGRILTDHQGEQT